MVLRFSIAPIEADGCHELAAVPITSVTRSGESRRVQTAPRANDTQPITRLPVGAQEAAAAAQRASLE